MNLKSGASHLTASAPPSNRSPKLLSVKSEQLFPSDSPWPPVAETLTCPGSGMAGPPPLPLLALTICFLPSSLSKFFSYVISFRPIISAITSIFGPAHSKFIPHTLPKLEFTLHHPFQVAALPTLRTLLRVMPSFKTPPLHLQEGTSTCASDTSLHQTSLTLPWPGRTREDQMAFSRTRALGFDFSRASTARSEVLPTQPCHSLASFTPHHFQISFSDILSPLQAPRMSFSSKTLHCSCIHPTLSPSCTPQPYPNMPTLLCVFGLGVLSFLKALSFVLYYIILLYYIIYYIGQKVRSGFSVRRKNQNELLGQPRIILY